MNPRTCGWPVFVKPHREAHYLEKKGIWKRLEAGETIIILESTSLQYFRKNQILPLASTDVVCQSAIGTCFSVSAHVTGRKFQSFEVLRGEAAAEFHFCCSCFLNVLSIYSTAQLAKRPRFRMLSMKESR